MANSIKKCPICKKPAVHAFRPFCSKRCKDVDLNRWLSDGYRVPGEEVLNPDMPADKVDQDPK